VVTEPPHILTELADKVLLVTLNRPERRNAFTRAMIDQLVAVLDNARNDADVHVIVITGAGDAFCAGFDMTPPLPGEPPPRRDDNAVELFPHRVALAMEELDKPVIAAVNGAAVGAGLGLALMADLRFFSDQALVWEVYVNAGIFPGSGDTWFLPRIVGKSKALMMLWTGEKLTAADALACGLADAVHPADQLLAETGDFAKALAERPPLIVRGIKRAVEASERGTLRDALGLAGIYTKAVGNTAPRPLRDRPGAKSANEGTS
jgi:enoyl-CoA hydratase/carnithine racemase